MREKFESYILRTMKPNPDFGLLERSTGDPDNYLDGRVQKRWYGFQEGYRTGLEDAAKIARNYGATWVYGEYKAAGAEIADVILKEAKEQP